MPILSDEKLKEIFIDKHDMVDAFRADRNTLENFLLYTFKRFKVGNNTYEVRREIQSYMEFLETKNPNDYEAYKLIRQRQSQEVRDQDDVVLKEVESQQYARTIKHKVDELTQMLKDANCLEQVQSVLDIGTEKLEFLDALEVGINAVQEAKRRQDEERKAAFVRGINIEVGFCHYDQDAFEANNKDTRFKLYDGKTIPHENDTFDLLTIFSVIHHIESADFAVFCHEMARVCKGYLFLKDVDLKEEVYSILFRVQHYLFEGVLLPGHFSYMNARVTKEETLRVLIEAGFRVIKVRDCQNFNKSYYALLQKVGVEEAKAKPYAEGYDIQPRNRYENSYRGGRGRGGRGRGGGEHWQERRRQREDDRYDDRDSKYHRSDRGRGGRGRGRGGHYYPRHDDHYYPPPQQHYDPYYPPPSHYQQHDDRHYGGSSSYHDDRRYHDNSRHHDDRHYRDHSPPRSYYRDDRPDDRRRRSPSPRSSDWHDDRPQEDPSKVEARRARFSSSQQQPPR